jgi:hypothetical protein
LAGCGAGATSDAQNKKAFAEIKASAAYQLKDLSSVQFRSLKAYPSGGGVWRGEREEEL